MLFMPAAGARPKETKLNLMDYISLCSEIEICYIRFALVGKKVRLGNKKSF